MQLRRSIGPQVLSSFKWILLGAWHGILTCQDPARHSRAYCQQAACTTGRLKLIASRLRDSDNEYHDLSYVPPIASAFFNLPWFRIDIVSFPKLFPPELRAAFLDLLEPEDLLGYSMASKAFNAEANRIRWRDYKFWFRLDGSGLDDACRPILRDPERAPAIKSLSILMARPSSCTGRRRVVDSCNWTSSCQWSMFSAALS